MELHHLPIPEEGKNMIVKWLLISLRVCDYWLMRLHERWGVWPLVRWCHWLISVPFSQSLFGWVYSAKKKERIFGHTCCGYFYLDTLLGCMPVLNMSWTKSTGGPSDLIQHLCSLQITNVISLLKGSSYFHMELWLTWLSFCLACQTVRLFIFINVLIFFFCSLLELAFVCFVIGCIIKTAK